MVIKEIITVLEAFASPALQESYDNAGLITGLADWQCTGVLVALDCTEAIITEAVNNGCNMIVTHHPIIFKGLKKINGHHYVERTIIAAIKNDIAIYAIHTNVDNVLQGVNKMIANKIGLTNCKPLLAKTGDLKKLELFVPPAHLEIVREALFSAGAGNIGNYSECGFSSEGDGSFLPGLNSNPVTGVIGERSELIETKLEVLYFRWQEKSILQAMKKAHPYEEVAHNVFSLTNSLAAFGTGLIGHLPASMRSEDLLVLLKKAFGTSVIRHTALLNREIKQIAVCGGAGSFLIGNALSEGVDAFITADLKYHDFFEADNKILLADIGHYESEQYTIELIRDILTEKFPNFAILKTGHNTNPVHYFC